LLLLQFRLGSHQLPIVLGRFAGGQHSDILVPLCSSNGSAIATHLSPCQFMPYDDCQHAARHVACKTILCTRKPADVICVTLIGPFWTGVAHPIRKPRSCPCQWWGRSLRTAPLNFVVHVPRRINIEANLQKLSLVACAGFLETRGHRHFILCCYCQKCTHLCSFTAGLYLVRHRRNWPKSTKPMRSVKCNRSLSL